MIVHLGSESNIFRLPMERRRRWQREQARGLGDDLSIPVASGVAVSTYSMKDHIFVGVSTGVLVWTITRLLDRYFKNRGAA